MFWQARIQITRSLFDTVNSKYRNNKYRCVVFSKKHKDLYLVLKRLLLHPYRLQKKKDTFKFLTTFILNYVILGYTLHSYHFKQRSTARGVFKQPNAMYDKSQPTLGEIRLEYKTTHSTSLSKPVLELTRLRIFILFLDNSCVLSNYC